MKSKLPILFLIFACTIISCSDKGALLEKFDQINDLIKDEEIEYLYGELDGLSKQYVDFCIDSTNWEFEKLDSFGSLYGLTIFTTVLGNQLKASSLGKENDLKKSFFAYLGVSQVPVFNWFQTPKILEDKSVVGTENYVVVATKINTNTYITSKVRFHKNEKGEFKLDLIELIKMREKVLFQAYEKYVKTNRKYGQEQDDMLKSFIENYFEAMVDLKEIKYRVK